MKLKTILFIILVSGIVLSAGVMPIIKPDITTDLTEQQKAIMRQKYNAFGYKIINCFWIENCYFCDYELGRLNMTKRMITCDIKTDLNENITMQDLVDKDVIQVVKAHTVTTTTMADNHHLDGKVKRWDKATNP